MPLSGKPAFIQIKTSSWNSIRIWILANR
jgi:hypothetical protein